MKRIGILLCAIALICSLAGCGSSPGTNTATKPCLRVNGVLYYQDGGEPVTALPEGYAYAGTLEAVKHSPRSDLTGYNVPDGSRVFACADRPEAVYLYAEDSEAYLCFVEEDLQYTYLMLDGRLYIWEDHYKMRVGAAPAGLGGFDGKLPQGTELRGRLVSAPRGSYPAAELETNFPNFAGYAVYADAEGGAAYVTQKQGSGSALRFVPVDGKE